MERNGCGAALVAQHKARKGTVMARHIAAIESGNVTKTNVIGLRKAVNHVARLEARYSGNRSNATPQEVADAMAALERCKPLVRGELHESGVRLITGRRYAKRLERVADIVAHLLEFRLVGYDRLGSQCLHSVPVYRAIASNGSWFEFRVVAWQSAEHLDEESGPTVLRAWHNV